MFLEMMELRELSGEGRNSSAGCWALPPGADTDVAACMFRVRYSVVAFRSVPVYEVSAIELVCCQPINAPSRVAYNMAVRILTSESRADSNVNNRSKSIVEVQVKSPI